MKRIISILITLCLVITCVQFPVLAEENNVTNEAAETLKTLGIIEGFGDDLMLDKVLTRAEFVTMIMRIINVDDISTNIYFEDVPESHWAASSIATVCELGIVNGYNSKEFKPDGILVYEEAVKMLVSVLGYSPKAEAKGGYPMGYLAVAQEIGLLDDVNGGTGLIMRRHHAAVLIFNALDIDLFVKEGIGDDSNYHTSKDTTLLTENLNIEKADGIIEANDVTSLINSSGVSVNRIKIGGKIYDAGETLASELIGCSVTYYADIVESDRIPTLLYVCESAINNTLTVNSKDILPSTTVTRLNYLKEGRTNASHAAISPYADFLYNGVSIGGFTATDLQPAYGIVTLIDNDGDGVADVVSVYEYETVVVGKVNKDKFAAYDAEDMSRFVELDPYSDEYSSVIYVNGEKREFKAVKKGGVLSVAKSVNTTGRKKHTVHFSDKSVSGVLDSIGDTTVVIDDAEYEITAAARADISNKIGESVNAYIDVFGNVVAIGDDVESSFKYGYIISCGMQNGLEGKLEARILTESGVVSIMTFADKVSVDDASPVSASTLPGLLALTVRGYDYETSPGVPDTAKQGTGVEQVIRYRLNGSGDISAIDTAVTDGSVGSGDNTLKRVRGLSGEIRVVGSAIGEENLEFLLEDDMIVFLLPPASDKDNYKLYSSPGKSYFVSNGMYDVETYDETETGGVKVCLYQSKVSSSIAIPYSTRPILVDSVAQVYENDEMLYKIDGYQSGNLVSVYANNKEVITSGGTTLAKGDIFRCALDNTNKIANIEPVLMGASVPANSVPCSTSGYGSSNTSFYASYRLVYGYATYKNGFSFIVETDPSDPANNIRYPATLTSGNRYYIVKGNGKTTVIEQVTEDALEEYVYPRSNCKVAMILESGNARDVIVYDID